MVQGLIAYWFYLRFRIDIAGLNGIFFGANVLPALLFLAAPAIARRIEKSQSAYDWAITTGN